MEECHWEGGGRGGKEGWEEGGQSLNHKGFRLSFRVRPKPVWTYVFLIFFFFFSNSSANKCHKADGTQKNSFRWSVCFSAAQLNSVRIANAWIHSFLLWLQTLMADNKSMKHFAASKTITWRVSCQRKISSKSRKKNTHKIITDEAGLVLW